MRFSTRIAVPFWPPHATSGDVSIPRDSLVQLSLPSVRIRLDIPDRGLA
jgi:hypothetical protein